LVSRLSLGGGKSENVRRGITGEVPERQPSRQNALKAMPVDTGLGTGGGK
jgi:hypothetical protein